MSCLKKINLGFWLSTKLGNKARSGGCRKSTFCHLDRLDSLDIPILHTYFVSNQFIFRVITSVKTTRA